MARCGEDVRTYRVSQILEMHALPERFTRPDGFDLAAHWQAYLAEFEARLRRGEAVVRLSPRGLERLPDLMTPGMAAAARDTAEPPDARGWTRVRLPVESVEHALGEFLRLGSDVEVLGPAELRERVAATAERIAALYRR